MSRKFSCLYTNQKTKKRKRWEDGFILLTSTGSVTLMKAGHGDAMPTSSLDSKYLSPQQLQLVLNGSCASLEFEGYLVEINDTVHHSKAVTTNTGHPKAIQNMPRFKIPAMIQKPAVEPDEGEYHYYPQTGARENAKPSEKVAVRGRYSVDDDELDDIWGSSADTKSNDRDDTHTGETYKVTTKTNTGAVTGLSQRANEIVRPTLKAAHTSANSLHGQVVSRQSEITAVGTDGDVVLNEDNIWGDPAFSLED
jgi:hypothetical protein